MSRPDVSSRLTGVVLQPVDMVARPSALIEGYASNYADNWAWKAYVTARLSAVFFVNLMLYAVPLTVGGYGVASTGQAPAYFEALLGPLVGNSSAAYTFLASLVQNSLFLFVAAAITFGTFHVGVWLTGSSKGFLQSLHTVVYSTGIYLAGIFTLVWYVSQTASAETAERLLLNLQLEFIYFFIDVMGANVVLAAGRPSTMPGGAMALAGKLAIAGILIVAGYYLYTLYLGARINHRASRVDSLLAVGFVALAPVIYVVGSLALALM